LKLDFHLLARLLPADPHKLELLGMVWEWCISTNEASVNGDGEDLLGQIIVVLGLRTSLALVNLLGLCCLGVVFVVWGMGTFLASNGGGGELATSSSLSDKII
jgi:hypothetical protein